METIKFVQLKNNVIDKKNNINLPKDTDLLFKVDSKGRYYAAQPENEFFIWISYRDIKSESFETNPIN
jgi:hypothetical protein